MWRRVQVSLELSLTWTLGHYLFSLLVHHFADFFFFQRIHFALLDLVLCFLHKKNIYRPTLYQELLNIRHA